MKKTIACFVLFCIAFGFTFVLAGCAKKCRHNWVLTSDTSTCEEDGVKTYECDICHAVREEFSLATKHDWEEIDSTATCTSGGVATYRCKKCNKTKQESLQAIGHSYDKSGVCKTCGRLKYDVSLTAELPKSFAYYSYSGKVLSICKVEKVEFYIEEWAYDKYLSVRFYGEKTYDVGGPNGTKSVGFMYVLKDSTGKIIESRKVYPGSTLIVGQQFGPAGYDSYRLCEIDYLSSNEKYFLEIFAIS